MMSNPIDEADAREVLKLRYWQHLINEMLKEKGNFKIPIHLAFGHEAAAVAVDRCRGPDDVVCLSHRNAVYNLVGTKSFATVLSHYQLTPRTNRASLMGSMNLAADGSAVAYASSILGNNLPVAAGIAMNRALSKLASVVFVFTGDGAMEEGSFWETMIFARSHGLPLVIVVENNDYSMSSTIAQRRSNIDLSKVCDGVGIRYFGARGAVLGETKQAFQSARAEAIAGNPACIELSLATFNQHAGPTPGWPDDPLNIALTNGLVVAEGPDDPVYQIKMALGDTEFGRLADQALVSANDVH